MKNTDARKLNKENLTDLRKRGVEAVQNGQSPAIVSSVLGVSVSTIFSWLARYRKGGWDALNAQKRGGRPPKLDGKKLKWIFDVITMKDPLQLKFDFALWNIRMIIALIDNQFGIRLSKASVSRLLRQLGLSPQKPLWRAYQQDQTKVQKWLDEEYPRIRTEARKVKAQIFFGDEAGIRSDYHTGTTWAPKGQTPIVKTTGARFGLNIISAVSARGNMRFMTVKGTVKTDVFIEFLKRLIHNQEYPVFLIVDGHPIHHAKRVTEFIQSANGKLKLFFLPGYSPELNPDEQVWNDLKNNGIGRKIINGADQLCREVFRHLRCLQRCTERIRSFFKLHDTLYAAHF